MQHNNKTKAVPLFCGKLLLSKLGVLAILVVFRIHTTATAASLGGTGAAIGAADAFCSALFSLVDIACGKAYYCCDNSDNNKVCHNNNSFWLITLRENIP